MVREDGTPVLFEQAEGAWLHFGFGRVQSSGIGVFGGAPWTKAACVLSNMMRNNAFRANRKKMHPIPEY